MSAPLPSRRTLSIGGATFDLFVRADHSILKHVDGSDAFALPLGTKIRVKEIVSSCGGGACNTSVGLARLGCTASFNGVFSDDQWGQNLMQNLKKEGVDTSNTTIVEGETSSFSILLTALDGERVTLYEPATNKHLDDVTFAREAAATMDWIVLNHINRESCELENDLADLLTKENAPKLTWNPGGCQIERGLTDTQNKQLLAHTTLLLVNRNEALRFAGVQDLDEALRILKSSGPDIVCVTDGKNGCIAMDKNHTYRCPAIDCKILDTTGAGDAFCSGATWALASGLTLPTALQAGTINATSVVCAVGAQPGLLNHTQMHSNLAKNAPNVIVTSHS